MDNAGADVVAGASQKCLELPPGLAPVAVGRRAWNYMDTMKNRRVPYILDFMSWKKASIEMHDYHPQPVTGATTMLYALDWIVDRIIEEGIENRQERFRTAGMRLKKGMAQYGFSMAADPRYASPVVTEFLTPEGTTAKEVREYYLKEHNTMVGVGLSQDESGTKLIFSNNSMRIAHFGQAAETERIDTMIEITRRFIEENNRP